MNRNSKPAGEFKAADGNVTVKRHPNSHPAPLSMRQAAAALDPSPRSHLKSSRSSQTALPQGTRRPPCLGLPTSHSLLNRPTKPTLYSQSVRIPQCSKAVLYLGDDLTSSPPRHPLAWCTQLSLLPTPSSQSQLPASKMHLPSIMTVQTPCYEICIWTTFPEIILLPYKQLRDLETLIIIIGTDSSVPCWYETNKPSALLQWREQLQDHTHWWPQKTPLKGEPGCENVSAFKEPRESTRGGKNSKCKCPGAARAFCVLRVDRKIREMIASKEQARGEVRKVDRNQICRIETCELHSTCNGKQFLFSVFLWGMTQSDLCF